MDIDFEELERMLKQAEIARKLYLSSKKFRDSHNSDKQDEDESKD